VLPSWGFSFLLGFVWFLKKLIFPKKFAFIDKASTKILAWKFPGKNKKKMTKSLKDPSPKDPFHDVDLSGQIILVTGGTSGLGREVVRKFAKAGASVIFTGKSKSAGSA
jgi:hypothetical protein